MADQPYPDIVRAGEPAATRPFSVRRELVIGYLAPAAAAGTAGLITGQADLQVAAFTSIAGTSAIVAGALAAWLHARGLGHRWARSTSGPVLAVLVGLGAAAFVGMAAVVITGAPAVLGTEPPHWLSRLRLDLPLSAGIAGLIVTWRWRLTLRRPRRGAERRHAR